MSNFIERFKALPRAQKERRIGFTLMWLMVPLLFYACSERLGGGSGYVYDAETKAPLAGVPVVLYVMSNTATLAPFMNSGGGGRCDSDFYAMTDANGRFEVPYFSLFVWWQPSLNARSPILYGTAYRKGFYTDMKIKSGISGADHSARKSGALEVEFAMVKETGTQVERGKYLGELFRAGCSYCTEFRRHVSNELLEMFPVPAQTKLEQSREIQAIGRREWLLRNMGTTQGLREACEWK
jgi:hypothetical protein